MEEDEVIVIGEASVLGELTKEEGRRVCKRGKKNDNNNNSATYSNKLEWIQNSINILSIITN